MGCFLSSSNHLVTTINNDNYSAVIGKGDQSKENVKLLFLGPEEAGKSTLFKQLKLIYGDPYTDTERRDHFAIIHFNILMETKQLIEKLHSLQLDDQIVAKREFQFLRSIDEYIVIDEKVGGALLIVWRDPAMKLLLERLDSSFNEVILYYLDKLEEIMIPKYLPSNEDILPCRARTAGIVHAEYKLSDRILEVFDVGGHPLRWIHCFEDVSAICFVVPLNLYNVQKESQNALMITLQLFEEVCRISMFEQVPILLVFNKYDLFLKKVKHVPVNSIGALPDYDNFIKNADDYKNEDINQHYFQNLFLSRTDSHRMITVAFTNGTETTSVMTTIAPIIDKLLQ